MSFFVGVNAFFDDLNNLEQNEIEELLGQDTYEYMANVSYKSLTEIHMSLIREELKVKGLLGHLNEVANDFDVSKSDGKAKAGCRFFELVNERIKQYNASTKWKDERIELFSLPQSSFYIHTPTQSKLKETVKESSKLEEQLKANIWL
ncbi:TPA: hypothetical protein ACX6PS_000047 [Photobacterium damselae]|uniref:hypothetical protein n=1 Tax=Photobacterium damselae TaxID=38293 RepID=UPI003B682298